MVVNERYSITVKPESQLVEIRFSSSMNFDLMERALSQMKKYIAENYQIKVISYTNRDCNYIRAFMLALSLFGNENRIIFENRARYSRAERRKSRALVKELRSKGYSPKQIAENLNIPLKTIYRWLAE